MHNHVSSVSCSVPFHFRIIGYLANVQGTTVDEVAKASITLAFITYPTALAQVWLSTRYHPGRFQWTIFSLFLLKKVNLQPSSVTLQLPSGILHSYRCWQTNHDVRICGDNRTLFQFKKDPTSS